MFAGIALAASTGPTLGQDAVAGEQVFKRLCCESRSRGLSGDAVIFYCTAVGLFMAHRDSSLRRQRLDALGAEADIPRASGACRSDEFDPSLPSPVNFAVTHNAALW
jgi:hypothetical protein